MSAQVYFHRREDWRNWLQNNFDKSDEVWLILPKKASGKPSLHYNDSVEEALCFGWIDSIRKTHDETSSMQRFTPRRKGSSWSQPNIERLKWLDERKLIHPGIREELKEVIDRPFLFPEDLMDIFREDPQVWKNFQKLSPGYQRIRVAYIDYARKRPEEFKKRLNNFLEKTRKNELIRGYGGVEKFY